MRSRHRWSCLGCYRPAAVAGTIAGSQAPVRRAASTVAATAMTASCRQGSSRRPEAQPGLADGVGQQRQRQAAPATWRTTEPITCGGGPARRRGRNEREEDQQARRPGADLADGRTEPRSTPMLTKAHRAPAPAPLPPRHPVVAPREMPLEPARQTSSSSVHAHDGGDQPDDELGDPRRTRRGNSGRPETGAARPRSAVGRQGGPAA